MNKNTSIILNNDKAIFAESTRCENHLYEYRCIIDTSLSYITFYIDMLIIVLIASDVNIALNSNATTKIKDLNMLNILLKESRSYLQIFEVSNLK